MPLSRSKLMKLTAPSPRPFPALHALALGVAASHAPHEPTVLRRETRAAALPHADQDRLPVFSARRLFRRELGLPFGVGIVQGKPLRQRCRRQEEHRSRTNAHPKKEPLFHDVFPRFPSACFSVETAPRASDPTRVPCSGAGCCSPGRGSLPGCSRPCPGAPANTTDSTPTARGTSPGRSPSLPHLQHVARARVALRHAHLIAVDIARELQPAVVRRNPPSRSRVCRRPHRADACPSHEMPSHSSYGLSGVSTGMTRTAFRR